MANPNKPDDNFDYFPGWEDHKARQKVPRPDYGSYRLEVEQTRRDTYTKTKNGPRKPFVAVRFLVVTSTNPSRPPGSRIEWFVDLQSEYPDMSYDDLKNFVAAVYDSDPDEVDKSAILKATGASNPLQGKQVNATFEPKRKKKAGEVRPGEAPASIDNKDYWTQAFWSHPETKAE